MYHVANRYMNSTPLQWTVLENLEDREQIWKQRIGLHDNGTRENTIDLPQAMLQIIYVVIRHKEIKNLVQFLQNGKSICCVQLSGRKFG